MKGYCRTRLIGFKVLRIGWARLLTWTRMRKGAASSSSTSSPLFHINKRNVPRIEKQTVDRGEPTDDTCIPGRGLQEMFPHFRTQLKWSRHKSIFEFALKTQQQQLRRRR